MKSRIVLLDESREATYGDFLSRTPHALFYASLRYRKLLQSFLGCEDRYFLALDAGGAIEACLPAFLQRNGRYGGVLNSLPFYGSNGAVIDAAGTTSARPALLEAFWNTAADEGCVSATLTTSPLDGERDFYDRHCADTYRDERIGQLTPLDTGGVPLMETFHGKTRNAIRKAMKSGMQIAEGPDDRNMDYLVSAHDEGIRRLGGAPKPRSFFDLLAKTLEYGRDYRLYAALDDGRPIAALLLFYFNRTVEYYTPVSSAEHRSSNPLNLVIHRAMNDARDRGHTLWNWGGTWSSQEGVYRFKSRWGTVDRTYRYYTRLFDADILHRDRGLLLREYPYFYVVPFDCLKSPREEQNA